MFNKKMPKIALTNSTACAIIILLHSILLMPYLQPRDMRKKDASRGVCMLFTDSFSPAALRQPKYSLFTIIT